MRPLSSMTEERKSDYACSVEILISGLSFRQLVPKLRLGTPSSETLFRGRFPHPRNKVPEEGSQTPFGN
jgi:hypothetical protein